MGEQLTDIDFSGLIEIAKGPFIGKGDYRTVWQCRLNSKYVLKYEHNLAYCNVTEHLAWDTYRGTKLEKWLAPVVWMSADTRWLVMYKTLPPYEWPVDVPRFFNDMSQKNYGVLDGRFVCHDYGSAPFSSDYWMKNKKARWGEA